MRHEDALCRAGFVLAERRVLDHNPTHPLVTEEWKQLDTNTTINCMSSRDATIWSRWRGKSLVCSSEHLSDVLRPPPGAAPPWRVIRGGQHGQS